MPGLFKEKAWRELLVFSLLLLIGMAYTFGRALDFRMPNPTKAIEFVFKPQAEFIQKVLIGPKKAQMPPEEGEPNEPNVITPSQEHK